MSAQRVLDAIDAVLGIEKENEILRQRISLLERAIEQLQSMLDSERLAREKQLEEDGI
jgi:proteasome assembly chaperone (PAC2) family protein